MKHRYLLSISFCAISFLTVFSNVVLAEEAASADRGQLQWRTELLGLAPKDAVKALREQIFEHYNYDTTCGRYYITDIPTYNCFVGYQQLLRALELMGRSAANPEILGVESIEVGTQWKSSGERWDSLKIEVPYSAKAPDIKRWITMQLQSGSRASDRKFAASLEDQVNQFSQRLGLEIQVAPELTPLQIERGLHVLSETISSIQENVRSNSASARRAEPLFDYVLLSHKNEGVDEAGEKLRLRFGVEQGVGLAVGALRLHYANCDANTKALEGCEQTFRTKAVIRFRKERDELKDIRKALSQFQIQCGEQDSMLMEHCIVGARSFQKAFAMLKPGDLGSVNHIVLTHRDLSYGLSPMKIVENELGGRTLDLIYTIDPKYIADSIPGVVAKAGL